MSDSPIVSITDAQDVHFGDALILLREFWLFARNAVSHNQPLESVQPDEKFFLNQLNGFLLPQHRFALAKSEHQCVGCVALTELQNDSYSNACEMHCLFVKPSFRGQGLGHHLIEQAMLWAQELKHSHLIFNPLGESESLRSIYSKFGFEEIPPLSHTHSAQHHLLMLELR
jgi:GNAT superfamily N-acetyltransferase